MTPAFFEFQPAGVPQDAVFVKNVTLGLAPNAVTTNVFGLAYKAHGRDEGGAIVCRVLILLV